jgi:hypothetical protein
MPSSVLQLASTSGLSGAPSDSVVKVIAAA